jgi:uncharacterized protein (TIGR00251 family)
MKELGERQMVPEISENAGAGTVSLQVRVQPRASRDEIAGVINGALKIRLQAPALENRANEALVEFLAHLLKTPKSAVRILGGERSRMKRIEIRGVTKQQVLGLLLHNA